jgi:UDP-N-acetylmuramate: L-alanyl-gamma-D-glutamyl-meso-diaminopimelate ligase
MKLGVMKDQLAPSLGQADLVFCYTSGLGWDANVVLAPLGTRARCKDDLTGLVESVGSEARPGDHVLVMSNGGFGGVHEKILSRLRHGSKSAAGA